MLLRGWNGKTTFCIVRSKFGPSCKLFRTWNTKMIKANSLSRHDMPLAQRKEYTKAVLCLQSKAPIAPKKTFPGSMNRFDDFVATHESQVSELHSTVSPLQLERI